MQKAVSIFQIGAAPVMGSPQGNCCLEGSCYGRLGQECKPAVVGSQEGNVAPMPTELAPLWMAF